MDWIDMKTVYILLHLFGVTLGAGGSFMIDVLFITGTKDRILDASEFRALKKGSGVVWMGLFLLIISGSLLVSLEPGFYFKSNKFLLKMIIVGVIMLNGLFFHFVHTPRLKNMLNKKLSLLSDFKKYSRVMYYSGAVSIVSWVSALVLGALRAIPVTLFTGLLIYLVLITVGIIGAEMKRRKFLKN